MLGAMIVSTRAAAAQLIDFHSQRNFVEKAPLFCRRLRDIAIREGEQRLCFKKSASYRRRQI